MNKHDEFRIEFSELSYEKLGRSNHYELLLGVQAFLRIIIDGREWFVQSFFPIVELAEAANIWLTRGGDFIFETVEAAESPFLCVRETTEGCYIEAAWQAFKVDRAIDCRHLKSEFSRFILEVIKTGKQVLGIDLEKIVRRRFA